MPITTAARNTRAPPNQRPQWVKRRTAAISVSMDSPAAQNDRLWLRALRNLLPPLDKGRDGVGIATPSRPLRGRPPLARGGDAEPLATHTQSPAGLRRAADR